jgi:hypothetical protein
MRAVGGDLDDETGTSEEADHFFGLDRIVLDDENVTRGLGRFEKGV